MNNDTPSHDIPPTTISELEGDEQPSIDETMLQEVEAEPDSIGNQAVTPEPTAPLPDPQPIMITSSPRKGFGSSKKRRVVLFGTAGAIVAAAAVVTWLVLAGGGQSEELLTSNQSSTSAAKLQPKLGVAVTVADGTVTYQKATDVQASADSWRPVTADTELSEGDQVRTGNGGRTVLTLDDGSAVRLDANSTVTLTSLAASDIIITQLAGTVYSRVVASERKYAVAVTDTTYEALGTAFVTVKKVGENGVQVYQSSVKADGKTIAEGKQYYSMNANADLQGKVTTIDVDTLIDNEFISWNLTEDEKDSKFKDKLGLLPTIKQRASQKKTVDEQTAKEKTTADTAEQERKTLEEKKKNQHHASKDKVTRGTMSLSLSGETFNWSYTGKAVHGYKLVWSNTNPNPHFTTDNSIYFSGINQLTGTLPGPEKTGRGTFYIRVCAYTAGTETEPCVDYSQVQSFTRQ